MQAKLCMDMSHSDTEQDCCVCWGAGYVIQEEEAGRPEFKASQGHMRPVSGPLTLYPKRGYKVKIMNMESYCIWENKKVFLKLLYFT